MPCLGSVTFVRMKSALTYSLPTARLFRKDKCLTLEQQQGWDACRQHSRVLTHGVVKVHAAQGAAEEQAGGHRVIGTPDAHAIVRVHGAHGVLPRRVPAARGEVEHLAQRLLQLHVARAAVHQVLELPHCAYILGISTSW